MRNCLQQLKKDLKALGLLRKWAFPVFSSAVVLSCQCYHNCLYNLNVNMFGFCLL